MELSSQFISASHAYSFSTPDCHIPAPYFRKSFQVNGTATRAKISVCGLGFYEFYLNGERKTKGYLAPYISNPDDILYYDCYELDLTDGKNVLAFWLGNGFLNNAGGRVWAFDKAKFRSAPMLAVRLEYTDRDGDHVIETDESFLCAESPMLYDDYRYGVKYDARLEIQNWNTVDFDDSSWKAAFFIKAPYGEKRECKAEPIAVTEEIKPISVTPEGDGFRYDFGVNTAGVCQIKINGEKGQEITLLHTEQLVDGKSQIENIINGWSDRSPYFHKDIYICKGEPQECYTPLFTYHGFRYVLVTGITAEQATPELLTYEVMHSDLKECGGFSCSDDTVNCLQKMVRTSDLSNFYYFPTDCPHREKNGWTGDAALSAEHMLLNLKADNSLKEWMRNICKAQNEAGAVPGYVPTAGSGFEWGNGPAWDQVMVHIPYYLYLYRGDTDCIRESATTILRYLEYLTHRIGENGLLAIGLGDWCTVGRDSDRYKAPLEFTDTVIAMNIARKAAFLFDAVGYPLHRQFAESLGNRLYAAARERLLDLNTMTAFGATQTTQAMALYYHLFTDGEQSRAFDRLLELIDDADGHMDTGILGGRVIFHVLSDFGRADLAYHMITRPDFPSYGHWVKLGATSLWEDFRADGSTVNSRNHHFWGDISSWFIQVLAGIRFNPHRNNIHEANIKPAFLPELQYAEGFYDSPDGRISVSWKRENENILLQAEVPDGMKGYIILDKGWLFEDGLSQCVLSSGSFKITKKKPEMK